MYCWETSRKRLRSTKDCTAATTTTTTTTTTRRRRRRTRRTRTRKSMDLDMVTKPTNAYERTRASYIIIIVSLLHVSATLVANLREVHHKGHITEVIEPVHKSEVFGSKTFVIYIYIYIYIYILYNAPPWGWPQEWPKHAGCMLRL